MRSPAEKLLWRSYDVVSKPLTMLSDTQIFYVGFALFCLITTLLVHNPLWRAAPEPPYKVGDIVRQTVISPADINYTDAAATERLRAEAQTAVKPIFRYESNKSEATVQGFVSTWEKLQRLRDTSEKSAGTEARSQVKWDGAGGAETARVLLSRQFSRNEIDAVQSALRESSTGYIYDDSDRQYFKNQVFVFDRSKPNLQDRKSTRLNSSH